MVDDRELLAVFWNSWFNKREIEKARAIAKTGSDAECRAELERLDKERRGRIDSWRWSQ